MTVSWSFRSRSSSPLFVEAFWYRAGLLGVRFRPGMATAFLNIPAAALTDDRAPLEAVWPDGKTVADYVGSALGTDQAIPRLAEMLAPRQSRIATVTPAHLPSGPDLRPSLPLARPA